MMDIDVEHANIQGENIASSRLVAACVYTTMIGDYENLNEQATRLGSSLRFICLTDNPHLQSKTWEIRPVEPIFARDPIRTQRDLKIRPHIYLPDIDRSI